MAQHTPGTDDLPPITIDGQILEGPQTAPQGAPIPSNVRRSAARQIAEARGSAASSRYTQRLVRSQPGTREYDDELRAAELVDLYFQELHRYNRARHEPIGQQS